LGCLLVSKRPSNRSKRLYDLFDIIIYLEKFDDDNEDVFYANMNVAITFIQNFNEEFVGTVARSKKKDYAANPSLPKVERLTELVSPEKKKIVFNYLKAYLERMIIHYKSYNKVHHFLQLEDLTSKRDYKNLKMQENKHF